MNILQFWTLRSDILKRVGKKYGKDEETEFEFIDSSGNVVDSEEINTQHQADMQVYSKFLNTALHLLQPSNRYTEGFDNFSETEM